TARGAPAAGPLHRVPLRGRPPRDIARGHGGRGDGALRRREQDPGRGPHRGRPARGGDLRTRRLAHHRRPPAGSGPRGQPAARGRGLAEDSLASGPAPRGVARVERAGRRIRQRERGRGGAGPGPGPGRGDPRLSLRRGRGDGGRRARGGPGRGGSPAAHRRRDHHRRDVVEGPRGPGRRGGRHTERGGGRQGALAGRLPGDAHRGLRPRAGGAMSALLSVYDRDLVIVSGKGARVTDQEGRTYLDFAAGIGVNGLGYGDRKVVAAIRKQADRLIHASNLYHNQPAEALAERLVALSFPAKVFLCNSGTEAVEAAIKFARRIGREQGRTELVAFERSFHGRTMGALSLTWTAKYREPFEPLVPGVHFCKIGDIDSVKRVLAPKTAAVVIEPVQGEGGVRPVPPGFLQDLARVTKEAGAVFVCDEIPSGLARP